MARLGRRQHFKPLLGRQRFTAAGGNQNVNAPDLAVSWVVPAVTLILTFVPASVIATWTVPAATITANVTLSPATVTATWNVPAATVTGGGIVIPVSSVTASWTVPAPTVTSPVTLSASTVTASWSVPSPTVTKNVTLTPASTTATWTIPTVTVTGGSILINSVDDNPGLFGTPPAKDGNPGTCLTVTVAYDDLPSTRMY